MGLEPVKSSQQKAAEAAAAARAEEIARREIVRAEEDKKKKEQEKKLREAIRKLRNKEISEERFLEWMKSGESQQQNDPFSRFGLDPSALELLKKTHETEKTHKTGWPKAKNYTKVKTGKRMTSTARSVDSPRTRLVRSRPPLPL